MAQNETQAGAAVAAARTLLGLTNGAAGAMAVLERCAGGTAEELQAAAAAAVQTARATAKAAVSAARYAASFDEIERLPARLMLQKVTGRQVARDSFRLSCMALAACSGPIFKGLRISRATQEQQTD